MKKARIILASIAIFAAIGGAYAFKLFSVGFPVFTFTDEYTQGTVTYTLANGDFFCIAPGTRNFTTIPSAQGAPTIAGYSTSLPPVGTLTLRSGALTKTIPSYNCITTSLYTTANL